LLDDFPRASTIRRPSVDHATVFLVQGPGFNASLGIQGQYPIGDAAQWQKIVENLSQ
jgi:hypothetical protein